MYDLWQYTARLRFLALAVLSYVEKDAVVISIDLIGARRFEKHLSSSTTAPQYLYDS